MYYYPTMIASMLSDAYKQSHIVQYPDNTTLVGTNTTARSDKHASVKGGVVVFNIQATFMKITEVYDESFFNLPKEEALKRHEATSIAWFGKKPKLTHVAALHDLGYLPIALYSLKEGTIAPIGIPFMFIHNTLPEFYWLTNGLETIISNEIWHPITVATIARGFKKLLTSWSEKTCDNNDHVNIQGHDFSMRGQTTLEATMGAGAAWLTSLDGSDSIPAIFYADKYYNSGIIPGIGGSIAATEHSVMSMGTKETEFETFKRLITELYPDEPISIVSDTFNLWAVLSDFLPRLREDILNRNGIPVIIRPDSGDPVDIICGEALPVENLSFDNTGRAHPPLEYLNNNSIDNPWDRTYYLENGKYYVIDKDSQEWVEISPEPKHIGVIESLYNTFGGEVNKKGYITLNSNIGAIYGDSINFDRANSMCRRLEKKGFASSNIALGIGSYTLQMISRDTYGMALKATYGELLNPDNTIEKRNIFKDPITDDGTKKSITGLPYVYKDENGKLQLKDKATWEEFNSGELKLIYKDGEFINKITWAEIKEELLNEYNTAS